MLHEHVMGLILVCILCLFRAYAACRLLLLSLSVQCLMHAAICTSTVTASPISYLHRNDTRHVTPQPLLPRNQQCFAVCPAGGSWTVFSSQKVPCNQGLGVEHGREQPRAAKKQYFWRSGSMPFPFLQRHTNEHQRTEFQQNGLQCTCKSTWNDLIFNQFQKSSVLRPPEFLSVLPFGARLRCCLGLGRQLKRRRRPGVWDLKVLGDCIIIHEVPCLSLKTCTRPHTPPAALAQTISAHCSSAEGSAPDPSESELASDSRASARSDPESLSESVHPPPPPSPSNGKLPN